MRELSTIEINCVGAGTQSESPEKGEVAAGDGLGLLVNAFLFTFCLIAVMHFAFSGAPNRRSDEPI
jgi:hypothetical protein